MEEDEVVHLAQPAPRAPALTSGVRVCTSIVLQLQRPPYVLPRPYDHYILSDLYCCNQGQSTSVNMLRKEHTEAAPVEIPTSPLDVQDLIWDLPHQVMLMQTVSNPLVPAHPLCHMPLGRNPS